MTVHSEKGTYASPDGSATWEYIAVISCASLVFCCGCIGGWISPTLAILMSPDSPIPLTSSEASTLAAMLPIGGTIASMLTMVADKLGRKNSLVVSSIPAIVSWAMIMVSANIMVLFGSKFISGLAFGLNMSVLPMYLGEIASVKMRGAIAMVYSIMMNAGTLFMFIIVPYLSIKTTACICTTIATASAISVWFIPDSPYFLAMVGKIDEAEGALEKLRGKTDVGEELELIKTTVRQSRNAKEYPDLREKAEALYAPKKPSPFKQIFTVPGNRRAFGITILFSIVNRVGSSMGIIIYGDIIFTKMNTGIGSQACTVIIAVAQIVSNILVVFIIDKVGRRPLICVSGLVNGLCVLVVGVYFYLMEYTEMDVTPYGLFAFGATVLNTIASSIGLLPLQTVVQSEVFDTGIKTLATSLMSISDGVLATLGMKWYLMVAEDWGYGHCAPFFSYAATAWICTVLILKLLPETAGKTLLDIQRDLNA